MHKVRPRTLLLACIAAILVAGTSPLALAQEATPGVEVDGVTILPPDADYAGVSRGEWAARSWQWTASMPPEVNPNFDPTGERCGYGQSGPVFFLPTSPSLGSRTVTCIVPEGMAIFVPLGAAICSTVNPPPFFGRTEAELQTCAATAMEGTRVEASVNGREVPGLERYRARSPLFPLLTPEENLFGVPAAVALAVVEGYALIIAPPSPGEYEITKLTIFSNPTETREATYQITVQAPQIIEPETAPEGSPEAATPVA